MIHHRFSAALIASTLLTGVLAVVCGCGGSLPRSDGRASSQTSSAATTSPASDVPLTDDERHDAALSYFIAGSIEEGKGNIEDAVSEYLQALKYADDAPIHAALAKNYLALQKPAIAATYARNAVERAPADMNYRRQLGELYIAVYELDSATVQFEELLRLDSTDVQTRYTLAGLCQKTKPLRALELYQSLLDRLGSDADVLFEMSRIHLSLGNTEKGIETLEALRVMEPTDEALAQTLAGLYVQSGRKERALALFLDQFERFPERTQSAIAAAGLQREMGHWKDADAVLRRALSVDSLSTADGISIGEVYFQQALADSTLHDQAQIVFDTLAARFPGEWRPQWYKGALYFNEGRMDSAASHFRLVVSKDPLNLQAHDILARAYLSLGDFEHAIKPLQTIIDNQGATADTWSFLGFALGRLGFEEKSMHALRNALAMDSSRMDALSTLALSYDSRGEFARSDSLYERALAFYTHAPIERDATYYLLCNNFAYTLAQRGRDLDRAGTLAYEALTFEERNSSYLDTYGWVCFRRGEYDKALGLVNRAIAIRREDGSSVGPTLYEHLGDIHLAMGHTADAEAAWRSALAEDPSSKSIQEKLLRLHP